MKDVGRVELGPDLRRGSADWNGQGDTVTGIVIARVKAKLHDLEPGLPAGVKIVSAYDRSELILRSIDNLRHTLIEEMIIVSIISSNIMSLGGIAIAVGAMVDAAIVVVEQTLSKR